MKIETVFSILTKMNIISLCATGLYIYLNPVLWYDFLYAIPLFFFAAVTWHYDNIRSLEESTQ